MIHCLSALTDNYVYAIDAEGGVIVIDPSEAEPVERWCHTPARKPIAIWCTHHHHDHVGAIPALLDRFGPLPVYGSAYDKTHDRIACHTHVASGTIESGGVTAMVIDVPGHTLGAVAYLVGDALFSGDTLFLSGCGRLFEGTAAMMHQSLGKLRALPDETRLYCGHEYALKNIAFARSLAPNDDALAAYQAEMQARRARNEPSVPGTLGTERRFNPLFAAGDVETFARLRSLRDTF